MAFNHSFVFLVVLLVLIFTVNGQPPEGNGFDEEAFDPVDAGSDVFEDRMNLDCDPRFRRFDGACTNDRSPAGQVFGSSGLAQSTYFGRGSTAVFPRNDLPSTRFISNMLAQQSMDVRESRGLNEMVTYIGQFLDHTLVATPVNDGKDDTMEEPEFIDVPRDDPMLANVTGGRLPFFRSRRAKVRTRSREERPINTLTSVVDLASVYGPSEDRANALRLRTDGLMKTGPNNLLPLNTFGLSNEPSLGGQFFVAGDARANEHPVLTSLHTVFLREHNDIARELKEKFPDFDDKELFENARQINIAQFQKIIFDEWYPAITGRNLPPYPGFRDVDPTVSVVFSTAAFRVGHTLVNDIVTRLGPQNSPMTPLTFGNIFFTNVALITNDGVDSFLRGALNTKAQEIDLMVVDALRNFLFSNVAGVIGLDLIALNLQRGRDHGLLPYNIIRSRFNGGRGVSDFSDITSNTNVQSALQTVYRSVDNVEGWIGLMAEDHASGSSMGPTMLAIWEEEFRRLRDGDRFYYENRDQYDPEVLAQVPRLSGLFNGQDTLREILLRNSDVTPEEFPSRTLFA